MLKEQIRKPYNNNMRKEREAISASFPISYGNFFIGRKAVSKDEFLKEFFRRKNSK